MAVSGKSQSVKTANAKGQTSNLLIDMLAFLELFLLVSLLLREFYDRDLSEKVSEILRYHETPPIGTVVILRVSDTDLSS